MFVRYFHTLFSYDGRVLCSHVFFVRYARTKNRTLLSLAIFARSFRTLFSHDMSARYFRTRFSFAFFARYFRTLFLHAISARYFRMPFPNFIFARYFHTLFAHVIFARCFRTLCSHANAISARFFRMRFESFLSPFGTVFGGHFGVILEPVLMSPGGPKRPSKSTPKWTGFWEPKHWFFICF